MCNLTKIQILYLDEKQFQKKVAFLISVVPICLSGLRPNRQGYPYLPQIG